MDDQSSGIEIGKVKQANECISVWDFSLSGLGEGSARQAMGVGRGRQKCCRSHQGAWLSEKKNKKKNTINDKTGQGRQENR